MRHETTCMMRIKNEARWLRRSLERTWKVCRRVVIFDDHSTDKSLDEALDSIESQFDARFEVGRSACIYRTHDRERELHWLRSPFAGDVDEVRDKNELWGYVARYLAPIRHVLCLDGDEMLSQRAIRAFPLALDALIHGGASVGVLPFVYLWDSETHRRIDGVYRDIRHARLFTIDRAPHFASARFVSSGRAGFHCGSIPAELNVGHRDLPNLEVVHFGYIDAGIRERKLEFYNRLDPGNEGEGYYRHIVGQPNNLAPGPVQLVPWLDN